MGPSLRRAAPLAPEARRAAIISATIPLLRLHGRAVTTAQIALAAGVAEGTLFRVFPDKDSLLAAAITAAFDPEPSCRELLEVSPHLPPRERVIAAVEVLQRRVEGIWQLIMVLGLAPPTDGSPPPHAKTIELLYSAFAQLFEPMRDELRCDPTQAARLLRIVTFAGTHPRIVEGAPLTAGEIVGVVLDGIRRRGDEEGDEQC